MIEKTKWNYYKMAILPDNIPHEDVDITKIINGEIWNKEGRRAIFARWTSHYDCGYESEWWYVIKTEPFDISKLNSKKRYKINRGLRNFDIKRIDATSYIEQIYDVQVKAYSGYPEKYRPYVDREIVEQIIRNEWSRDNIIVIGAFQKETGLLEGYIQLEIKKNCIISVSQKANPAWEKFQINYALLAGVLDEVKELLDNGYYISVGERNVQHETAFQDFVIDIFQFRKAYCRLNLVYNPRVKWIVKLLYIFKINGVLEMEAIIRNQGSMH